jgi:hypothetical protein
MILLPVDAVKPFINDYYMEYLDGELLGFMPCSSREPNYASYWSVETTQGSRVVPVFYLESFVFDSESINTLKGPALYFKGSDDGSTGVRVESREHALKWISEQPFTDFELIMQDIAECYRAGKPHLKLEYHN